MIALFQILLYLLALAGVAACSVGLLYFAGRAMNRARDPGFRARQAVIAFACLCGIVASAAAGFVGVGAIMYLATR